MPEASLSSVSSLGAAFTEPSTLSHIYYIAKGQRGLHVQRLLSDRTSQTFVSAIHLCIGLVAVAL